MRARQHGRCKGQVEDALNDTVPRSWPSRRRPAPDPDPASSGQREEILNAELENGHFAERFNRPKSRNDHRFFEKRKRLRNAS